jgi:hypothetical protein
MDLMAHKSSFLLLLSLLLPVSYHDVSASLAVAALVVVAASLQGSLLNNYKSSLCILALLPIARSFHCCWLCPVTMYLLRLLSLP